MLNRRMDVNRGHVLGGSSALNYLCYDRAAAAEYDAWGDLGNDGWGWDVMINGMVKSENFTGSNDGDIHGRSGPIRSLFNRIVPDILQTWKPTLNGLGVNINTKGGLGGDPIGVMFQPTNIDPTRYTRSYSASSYLPLAGSNLVVKTNSLVAKVEFAKNVKPLVAVGVILQDGTKFRATKEVILSAGAVQSPGLLELSGIGQTSVLKAANIPQLVNLPGVGENYQDHIRVGNTYRLKANLTSFDPFIFNNTGALATQELQKWLAGSPSMYDYTTVAYAFLNWDQIVSKDTVASLALLAAKAPPGKKTSVVDKKKLDFLRDPSVPEVEIIMEDNYVGSAGYPGGNFMTLLSTVMHPFSRGNVHIDPAAPLGKPVIDPQYLSSEYDLQALVEAAKYSRKAAQSQPMASIWDSEFEPGRAVQTDDQWREWARKSVLSFYHPVGTCAMLPKKDGGVVDASLTVYGTSNLRVVDNSIIPVLISAHIQTAAYGIAEVAADIIISASC